jgi:hypothetical protein
MQKLKISLLVLVIISMTASSCGLFHKSCNCPHFGRVIKVKKNNTELQA